MASGWTIIDAVTGLVVGTQYWDDPLRPVLQSGQKAVPFAAGGGNVLSGTFAAIGQSASAVFSGEFNVSLWGMFVATVALERSFDGGTTWTAVSIDVAGASESVSAPLSIIAREPELGVLYRLNCMAFTSGTVSYRVSQ